MPCCDAVKPTASPPSVAPKAEQARPTSPPRSPVAPRVKDRAGLDSVHQELLREVQGTRAVLKHLNRMCMQQAVDACMPPAPDSNCWALSLTSSSSQPSQFCNPPATGTLDAPQPMVVTKAYMCTRYTLGEPEIGCTGGSLDAERTRCTCLYGLQIRERRRNQEVLLQKLNQLSEQTAAIKVH